MKSPLLPPPMKPDSPRLAAIEEHLDAIDHRLERFKVVLEAVHEQATGSNTGLAELGKSIAEMKLCLDKVLETHTDYANEVVRVHSDNIAIKSNLESLKGVLTFNINESKTTPKQ